MPYAEGAIAETHAYVEQPSSLTWEGVVAGYGNIAREAKRGTGWRRVAGLAICIIFLAPILAGFVVFIIGALGKL